MPDPLFSVENKVVVITGGLGQLGAEFGRALLERGARVAVLDQRIDADAVRRRYGEKTTALFLEADVTVRASLELALAKIEAQWGTPHVLVNNAALDSPPGAPAGENGPFESYAESSFDRVMDVNVKGVLLCCQVLGGAMARAGRGSIINISSIYGLVSPDQNIYEYRRQKGEVFFKPVAYAVSKSALFNLTRYLATYWAKQGVRVNTLTFAGVYNHQAEEFLRSYCPKVPLGRMARADEYNGAVVFLASDASSYMTGSNLVLDGGFTAW
ncbi:MAG TPA: SDR family oxidoreductase [Opitutaceae bacterium]|nr:SDR family oxidoreductase [Opitutaceae bacterium]